MLDVCLLGCGGMLPLPQRFLTALLVRHDGKQVLIDCGESTQVAAHMCGWGFKAIDAILITHFHGDHVVGLPGLLMTMGNHGRTEPVHIYGGTGLQGILNGLLVVCPQLPFDIVCHEIQPEDSFFVIGLQVKAVAVEHRVPCLAYSLSLSRQGKFDVEKAKANQVPKEYWNRLQKGEIVQIDGRQINPEDVLGQTRKGLKITYATDCRPSDRLVELAKDSDLLVAEGLYGDSEKQGNAKEKGHMVYAEAATLAKSAEVGTLWLTHYSPALLAPEEYIDVAREIFSNSFCGTNLMQISLRFSENR